MGRGRPGRKLVAFGEEKTAKEWTKDPRCVVNSDTLLNRLLLGYRTEDAITTERFKTGKAGTQVAAFGEEKNLKEWSRDSRAQASAETIRLRLKKGWKPERAIAEPPIQVNRTKIRCGMHQEVKREGVESAIK